MYIISYFAKSFFRVRLGQLREGGNKKNYTYSDMHPKKVGKNTNFQKIRKTGFSVRGGGGSIWIFFFIGVSPKDSSFMPPFWIVTHILSIDYSSNQ